MTYMPPMFEGRGHRWRKLDPIVRLMLINWAFGMALGAVFAGSLLCFDVMGLRTLLAHSNAAFVGGAAFVILFALSFGGLVAATAAMRAGDDDDEPRGGLRQPVLAYATVRAR